MSAVPGEELAVDNCSDPRPRPAWPSQCWCGRLIVEHDEKMVRRPVAAGMFTGVEDEQDDDDPPPDVECPDCHRVMVGEYGWCPFCHADIRGDGET